MWSRTINGVKHPYNWSFISHSPFLTYIFPLQVPSHGTPAVWVTNHFFLRALFIICDSIFIIDIFPRSLPHINFPFPGPVTCVGTLQYGSSIIVNYIKFISYAIASPLSSIFSLTPFLTYRCCNMWWNTAKLVTDSCPLTTVFSAKNSLTNLLSHSLHTHSLSRSRHMSKQVYKTWRYETVLRCADMPALGCGWSGERGCNRHVTHM